MRKIKTHIFAENLDDTNGRTWKYGKTMLTSEEMERVKKRLPEGSKIVTLNFESPENYVYPGDQKEDNNLNLEQNEIE